MNIDGSFEIRVGNALLIQTKTIDNLQKVTTFGEFYGYERNIW
jgi:hypothetical protein